MSRVKVRSYASPTLVLLAFDWPEGERRKDFLGFALERTPGFWGESHSWLPNRLSFQGAIRKGEYAGSDRNPVQKFLWWDARIDDEHRGTTIEYGVVPVVGSPDDLQLLNEAKTTIRVPIPHPVEGKVGCYFNRATVSSQAFAQKFRGELTDERMEQALVWLANGLEKAIPSFLSDSQAVEGAIYHLSDEYWTIPALTAFPGQGSIVYNSTKKDQSNAQVVEALEATGRFDCAQRTKAAIMHNKFLVRVQGGEPRAVLLGSANFTTSGLATQANVLHTFESRALARLYLERKRLLQDDPPVSATAKDAGWSDPARVGDASIRVFFSPEPSKVRESIDTIVKAIRRAKKSVIFCLFMPTDAELRNAAFEAADRGRMMFGLVNKIPLDEPDGEPKDAAAVARVELYHRSRHKRDVFSHALFARSTEPEGFWWEVANLPGHGGKFPVYIHHKFVIIDAETSDPTVYTGSANMSKGSLHKNDENLLEIKGSRKLAAIYLAEGLRLYEHYRARAVRQQWENRPDKYALRKNNSWARKYFVKGSPEAKARVAMASKP